MAYAKFVTHTNKEGKPVSYGPYYYKSVRTPEGKVRNIYLGIAPEAPEVKENESVTKGTRRIRKFLVRLVNS